MLFSRRKEKDQPLEKQLEEIRKHFIDCLSIDFGYILITNKIKNWPALTWTELLKELEDQEINIRYSLNRSWRSFFTIEKEKYNLLKLFQMDNNRFERITDSSSFISCN